MLLAHFTDEGNGTWGGAGGVEQLGQDLAEKADWVPPQQVTLNSS